MAEKFEVEIPVSLVVASPIEAKFLTALLLKFGQRSLRWEWLGSSGGRLLVEPPGNQQLIRITPQHSVGRYSCDLLLQIGEARVVVECDGHDFHERTPEQAEHDKKRDRYFVEVGETVLRFTGREINRDAASCAEQALSILEKKAAQ